ncbi:hypothetical protein HK098_003683 [Nowakowskiella sp. JEL0407]|nr:hypothetical protein HK098_003683 [Nowakowskiella sp. JEL0407]
MDASYHVDGISHVFYSSTAPLFKVKGVNHILFEMLRFSKALIVFDGHVDEIEKKNNKDDSIVYQVKSASGEVVEYDVHVVIVATPLVGDIYVSDFTFS